MHPSAKVIDVVKDVITIKINNFFKCVCFSASTLKYCEEVFVFVWMLDVIKRLLMVRKKRKTN